MHHDALSTGHRGVEEESRSRGVEESRNREGVEEESRSRGGVEELCGERDPTLGVWGLGFRVYGLGLEEDAARFIQLDSLHGRGGGGGRDSPRVDL